MWREIPPSIQRKSAFELHRVSLSSGSSSHLPIPRSEEGSSCRKVKNSGLRRSNSFTSAFGRDSDPTWFDESEPLHNSKCAATRSNGTSNAYCHHANDLPRELKSDILFVSVNFSDQKILIGFTNKGNQGQQYDDVPNAEHDIQERS